MFDLHLFPQLNRLAYTTIAWPSKIQGRYSMTEAQQHEKLTDCNQDMQYSNWHFVTEIRDGGLTLVNPYPEEPLDFENILAREKLGTLKSEIVFACVRDPHNKQGLMDDVILALKHDRTNIKAYDLLWIVDIKQWFCLPLWTNRL